MNNCKRMTVVKLAQIPLCSPFFKGGNFFPQQFKPLFGKEGKGEIFGRNEAGNYVANF